jgi:hypothetical protein
MRIKIIHITPLGLFNIRLNILTPRAITSAATAATATTALAAVSAVTGADTAGKTLKPLALPIVVADVPATCKSEPVSARRNGCRPE